MKYLLDTNVVSEQRRRHPDARVATWFEAVASEALHVSVLTLGEIAKGAAALAARDPVAARRLRQWMDEARETFGDRILPVDAPIAETWGRLSADRPRPVVDTLLAATALTRGMTLVTRNLRDVRDTGVLLLNPWETE